MDKLGIEPVLLITQIINFAILALVLTKFLYKPILKLIDQRKKTIEEGLELTAKMKVKEEEMEKEKEAMLDKAKAEGQKIIEESKERGRKVEAEIISVANSDAKVIKEKASKDLETERAKLWSELEKEVLSVASAMAKTVVSDVLDQKSQMVLIDRKLAKMEKEKLHAVKD